MLCGQGSEGTKSQQYPNQVPESSVTADDVFSISLLTAALHMNSGQALIKRFLSSIAMPGFLSARAPVRVAMFGYLYRFC